MDAPFLLKAWRSKTGISQMAMAEKLGVRQATLSEWEGGNRTPQLDHAIRIEALTEGAVPIESWSDDPEVRSDAKRALDRRACAAAVDTVADSATPPRAA